MTASKDDSLIKPRTSQPAFPFPLKKSKSSGLLLMNSLRKQRDLAAQSAADKTQPIRAVMDNLPLNAGQDLKIDQSTVGVGPFQDVETTVASVPDLPPFDDPFESDCVPRIIEYLQACTIPTSWSIHARPVEVQNRQKKHKYLKILSSLISTVRSTPQDTEIQLFPESTWQTVREFLQQNLLRPLLPLDTFIQYSYEFEDEDNPDNVKWTQLEHVYDIFIAFLMSPELIPKQASVSVIDTQFVISLFHIFDSPDSRERATMKSIIHRIYARFSKHRLLIRNLIAHCFHKVSFCGMCFLGTSDLLELMASIFSGLTVPVKNEYLTFYLNNLFPLVTSNYLPLFSQQLSQCICIILNKCPQFINQTISSLIRFWPRVNSTKECIFLSILELIVEFVEMDTLLEQTLVSSTVPLAVPAIYSPFTLFYDKLDSSTAGPPSASLSPLRRHSLSPISTKTVKQQHPSLVMMIERIVDVGCSVQAHVAEQALLLFENQSILELLTKLKMELFPVIFDKLHANKTEHWSSSVREKSEAVLNKMDEIDKMLTTNCFSKLKSTIAKRESQKRSNINWERIEALALNNLERIRDQTLNPVEVDEWDIDEEGMESFTWWVGERRDRKQTLTSHESMLREQMLSIIHSSGLPLSITSHIDSTVDMFDESEPAEPAVFPNIDSPPKRKQTTTTSLLFNAPFISPIASSSSSENIIQSPSTNNTLGSPVTNNEECHSDTVSNSSVSSLRPPNTPVAHLPLSIPSQSPPSSKIKSHTSHAKTPHQKHLSSTLSLSVSSPASTYSFYDKHKIQASSVCTIHLKTAH
ncbi:putative Serine/threonine-protein phosphatase 2A 56 kDa regulatory subunit delta [Blattamonas nauphoetae]|uniref:Serine/threonine-protein phosphatase 2A 56 kDa regulatory subunit delta n=1 Tax=Blattamonas nauphoetae TaxID=2049346 RepID=A0ABQ9YFR3_9EUKA|nr:putative Serine/threonine-protein phosphatase 2A 56 kDa regulatory subunit delta [Blattamonas nauphoetae]